MMNLSELWGQFKLLTPMSSLKEDELVFVERFLREEHRLREDKRIRHLLRRSGIKRVKLLSDFDWTFNPKIPREQCLH